MALPVSVAQLTDVTFETAGCNFGDGQLITQSPCSLWTFTEKHLTMYSKGALGCFRVQLSHCEIAWSSYLVKKGNLQRRLPLQLENVATANALQHEAVRRSTVPIHFNFVARAKFELAQPIRCRLIAFLLLIRYVTLWPWTTTPWPWPLTFDLEHL